MEANNNNHFGNCVIFNTSMAAHTVRCGVCVPLRWLCVYVCGRIVWRWRWSSHGKGEIRSYSHSQNELSSAFWVMSCYVNGVSHSFPIARYYHIYFRYYYRFLCLNVCVCVYGPNKAIIFGNWKLYAFYFLRRIPSVAHRVCPVCYSRVAIINHLVNSWTKRIIFHISVSV